MSVDSGHIQNDNAYEANSCSDTNSAKHDILSTKNTLKCILRELIHHYSKMRRNDTCILNAYYMVDCHNKWISIGTEKIFDMIEHILHGKLSNYCMKINEQAGKLFVHESSIQNGLPLILFQTENSIFAIKKRESWSTHLHLFKFQPIINGMQCKVGEVKDILEKIDREYMICINDEVLNELTSLWLGVDVSRIDSTLIVDGNGLATFLELIVSEPSAKCFLLLSGQSPFFAYLQVNDKKDLKFILPIGSICLHD